MSTATCYVSLYVWTRSKPASELAGEQHIKQARECKMCFNMRAIIHLPVHIEQTVKTVVKTSMQILFVFARKLTQLGSW